jgi:hypothetical protein
MEKLMKDKNPHGKRSHRGMKGQVLWMKELYPELFIQGHKSQRKKRKKQIKIEEMRKHLYV